jgi:NTE family protein
MVQNLSGKVGLVLSGAVAQGGFEAGALGTLAAENPDMAVTRFAGTSSGALNATIAAVGVATRQLAKAAEVLQNLWINDGSLWRIADVPWRDWPALWSDRLHLRGALDTSRLQLLVQKAIREVLDGWNGTPADVTLTLVTTNLNAPTGPVRLPVYELPVVFGAQELVDPTQWKTVANAAAASATFPGLFAPTSYDGSPCIDGGAVNNSPISYVLRDPRGTGPVAKTEEPDVKTVVVVTTEFSMVAPTKEVGGTALVSRVASALIDERIAYDLAQAKKVNQRYHHLDGVLRSIPAISAADRRRVLEAARCWPIDLYLVQPTEPLEGDAFSGFLHEKQRRQYVEAGKKARIVPI